MTVLVDTGFWKGYFYSGDQYHEQCLHIMSNIEKNAFNVLLPFPSLYELLNAEFCSRTDFLKKFHQLISRRNFQKIDDAPYRYQSLRIILSDNDSAFSLVDV